MNLINQKTLYIYKENPDGHWTVLFSHPFMDYTKHTKNRYGIPIMYFTEIEKTFNDLFKDYMKIFRKPNRKTNKRMQWTIMNEVYIVESARMLTQRPLGNEIWKKAVETFWDSFWVSIRLKSNPALERYKNMTVDEIYDLLVLEVNEISLN